MTRIRFEFDSIVLDAELLDTPTAKAILGALPLTSSALTWGEEADMIVLKNRDRNATNFSPTVGAMKK